MRWAVEKTGDHLWIVEPRASGQGVERVVSHFCDDYLQLTPEAQAQRDADAKLLAAAPTLLAALQSIRQSVDHALQNERWLTGGDERRMPKVLETLDAALKEAL